MTRRPSVFPFFLWIARQCERENKMKWKHVFEDMSHRRMPSKIRVQNGFFCCFVMDKECTIDLQPLMGLTEQMASQTDLLGLPCVQEMMKMLHSLLFAKEGVKWNDLLGPSPTESTQEGVDAHRIIDAYVRWAQETYQWSDKRTVEFLQSLSLMVQLRFVDLTEVVVGQPILGLSLSSTGFVWNSVQQRKGGYGPSSVMTEEAAFVPSPPVWVPFDMNHFLAFVRYQRSTMQEGSTSTSSSFRKEWTKWTSHNPFPCSLSS